VTQKAHKLVRRNHPIKGQLEQHSFDVVVANPFFATQGLSFEVSASRILDLEVDATAFAFSDVHAQHHEPQLGVLTLPPPQGKLRLFDKAQSLFHALKADVLESED
jgi:hypothetical protein